MNKGYYFDIQRRFNELEQNFGQSSEGFTTTITTEAKFHSEYSENAAEDLCTDYEVVGNEDDLCEDRASESVDEAKFPISYANDASRKLHLNLSAAKITLTGKSAKINKSIAEETEAIAIGNKNHSSICRDAQQNKVRQTTTPVCQQHDDRRRQHMPITFTIVPINLAQKHTSVDGGTGNGDPSDGNNLPEIVLTSFQTRSTKLKSKSAIVKQPQSVSFQTSKQSIKQLPPDIPIILQQTEVIKHKFPQRVNFLGNTPTTITTTVEAEVYERARGDSEEYNDTNSQFGSSTSPESLMDNILSAASSVSVRSSSLSSAGTDAVQLAAAAAEAAVIVCINDGVDVGHNDGGSVAGVDDSAMVNIESHAGFNANNKETRVNRSLNPKSTELKVSPPLLQTSPTLPHSSAAPTLQPPELSETGANHSRSPSPSHSISIRVTPDSSLFPEDLKCPICSEIFRDPRTLNCLHSFCFECIVNENFKQDTSIPFWSQPGGEDSEWKASNKSNYSIRSSSPEMSLRSSSDAPSSPLRQRNASLSFIRKKSLEKILLKTKSDGRGSECSSMVRSNNNCSDERQRLITCKICDFATDLPVGGIRQLPQNFMLVRKMEELKLKMGSEVLSRIWCSLCFDETSATYHCLTCTLNLCTLCKEAHERQRNTANHKIRNIMEVRRARKHKQTMLDDNSKFTLKCSMHAGFEMKSFCSTCLQVACADCLVLLHKGHKHEPITKAIVNFSKILRDSTEQTRPLCSYAEHSIGRLNEIAKSINKKCDEIQAEVEAFMVRYFEAVEVHRRTLLQQVLRARESKVDMILEQQLDLQKRNGETMEAVRFSQELCEIGSDVEILSFVSILLKRFEYCQQFKTPVDPKISDSLHFLTKIRAPSTKETHDIPLYGIITMQTVEPSLCTLQWEGFSQLRLHKQVDLVMMSRDADGVPLCHGGLQINALLKYKESNTKYLPVEISDHRDGTYNITFTPDSQGTVVLTVTINDKPIKGSPFTFLARTVRPHSGIYHCCAFCSGKGSKTVKCSCDGRMPGYNGCGHGHVGHPGRRHWSCCGNVLENSECNVANKAMNT